MLNNLVFFQLPAMLFIDLYYDSGVETGGQAGECSSPPPKKERPA